MDIFQNQCSESLGFDSMLSSNHLNSPLHDSPGSPNPLTFAPSPPYFSSISQQLCGGGASIFVKIPTQINQQYQQENRLRNARTLSNEIKCEDRAEPIKSEMADSRLRLANATISEQLPDVIENYLNDTRGAGGVVEELSIFRCDCCPFASMSEATLGEHKQTNHASGVRMLLEPLGCPICENKFFKKSVLEMHLLEDHEMARNEVEILCDRAGNFQPNQNCGQTFVTSTVAQTSAGHTPTMSSTVAPNKSRIYIKNVQLLKNPDVFAPETEIENIQQGQGQHGLSVEQQSEPTSNLLCSEVDQLTTSEPSSHDQFLEEEHPHHHHPSQQTALNTGNSSKIFLRNVSLLQNVNFAPSVENILLSNGSKYHTYMNLDCQSNASPPIDAAAMEDCYGQMLPASVTAQPRSNRIYIKNVDILRNPLLSLECTTTASNSYNVTTTSRASSCESIICTSTPPPSTTLSQTMSSAQPTATIIPMSQIPSSQSQLASTGDQSLPNGGMNGSLRPTMDGGLGGLITSQPQHLQPMDQGSTTLPLMFSTDQETTGVVASSASVASSGISCTSVVPVCSPALMASNSTGNCYQLSTFDSDGQQHDQQKSKIFIKNISVLKQPTIHLKSVDEVNLMTYDQLQLQNLLPVTVPSTGTNMNIGSNGGESIGSDRPIDQSFGRVMEVNVNHQQQQQQQQQEDTMDTYHDAGCYGDLDVCDFTDGFNERDDPGGGEGAGGHISVPSDGSENNTVSINCAGILTDAHCDNFQSGFGQDIILLQPNSGVEEHGNDKMSENWSTVGAGSLALSHDMAVPSESFTAEDGSASVQYKNDDQQRDKDILFLCTQDVINLDPSIEEAKVAEEMHRAEGLTDQGGQPMEQAMFSSDAGFPSGDSSLQSALPTVGSSERPRARGRPKGAKQTGITKLKKLYTNLTAQEEGYKCDMKDCGARFRQPERLEYHRKCHLAVESLAGGDPAASLMAIRCPECGSQEFRNWNTLHTHLWREHAVDMELYSCHLCAFKTPVLCRLTNTHMKIHSEERNFKCVICEKAFKNNKQLRNHRRSHREPTQTQQQQQQQQDASPSSDTQPQLSCDRMEVDVSSSESGAKVHKVNVTPLPIKCVKCGQKFTSQRQLHSHMDLKHPTPESGQSGQGTGKHRCVLCGMMFKTRYLLQSHSAKHSDEKRFKCEQCDYTTNDHNAFRRHKMRHNTKGSHMYKCSYCDYTSIQSTTYRKHLERMHADVASTLLYKCARCPFVSISELKYQLHKAKHEGSENVGEDFEDGDARNGDNRKQDGSARETQEQMQVEDGFPMVLGDNQPLHNELEDDSRACESVNSDVMIVDNREPMHAVVTLEHPGEHRDEVGLQTVQQQPMIRPAMFANNFSKVDNFYGHQQQLLQPKILKLTDRIPSHRVSPLGPLQLQPQTLQSSLLSAIALPNVLPPSSVVTSQELSQGTFQMATFEMQHQQQYEHDPTLTNTVDDISVLGRN